MDALSGAIVGHLVGDYLLQNDWMAKGKKHNTWICLSHCVVWAISVCLFAQVFSVLAFALLLATHFAQDRTSIVRWYMIRAGQAEFATGVLSPWSIIVVDNVFHVLAIYLVIRCVI